MRGASCWLLAAAFLAVSCGKRERVAEPEGMLARVDAATLTREDVVAAMPVGLSADDSVRFVRAYVRNWVDTRLIEGLAAERVDMERIDAMVAQYRRDLIVREYRDRMFSAEAADAEFSDSTVAAYYERNKGDFVLDRPLIRGVYIKLPDDARELGAIRRIYRSTRPADIDRLEKEVLGSAIHYDYFRDRWIDWEQVEARIPYDFGPNPADFVGTKRNLDVSVGGFTYLLEISDVLPAGAPMPVEVARPLVEERLLAERRRSYDSALRTRLYDDGVSAGRVVVAVPQD